MRPSKAYLAAAEAREAVHAQVHLAQVLGERPGGEQPGERVLAQVEHFQARHVVELREGPREAVAVQLQLGDGGRPEVRTGDRPCEQVVAEVQRLSCTRRVATNQNSQVVPNADIRWSTLKRWSIRGGKKVAGAATDGPRQ